MEPVNAIFFGLLALAVAGAAWWIHRSRVDALRRQLREAQDSTLELAETAATLHRRLAEADQALATTPATGDAEQRRAALGRALAAAAPAPASWEDTHPLTIPGFQQTQPAPLDEAPR
jgi:hypothetical protein